MCLTPAGLFIFLHFCVYSWTIHRKYIWALFALLGDQEILPGCYLSCSLLRCSGAQMASHRTFILASANQDYIQCVRWVSPAEEKSLAFDFFFHLDQRASLIFEKPFSADLDVCLTSASSGLEFSHLYPLHILAMVLWLFESLAPIIINWFEGGGEV